MTPERKHELEAVMDRLIDQEIRAASRALIHSPAFNSAEVSTLMADLSDIKACIGVAFAALNLGRGRKS